MRTLYVPEYPSISHSLDYIYARQYDAHETEQDALSFNFNSLEREKSRKDDYAHND